MSAVLGLEKAGTIKDCEQIDSPEFLRMQEMLGKGRQKVGLLALQSRSDFPKHSKLHSALDSSK